MVAIGIESNARASVTKGGREEYVFGLLAAERVSSSRLQESECQLKRDGEQTKLQPSTMEYQGAGGIRGFQKHSLRYDSVHDIPHTVRKDNTEGRDRLVMTFSLGQVWALTSRIETSQSSRWS